MVRLIVPALALGCLLFAQPGCSNKTKLPGARTEGDRMVLQSKLMAEKGEMMRKGEVMVAEGEGMKAKGEVLRKQGKTIEGDRLVRDGELKIMQGKTIVEQAEDMNTNVEATADMPDDRRATTRPAVKMDK